MDKYIAIAGVTLDPQPSFSSGYTWSRMNVSSADSGRTEDAVMHNTIVGKKYKINLKWSYITMEQAAVILNLVEADEFTVTFPDPLTNTMKTITAYVGDRSAGFYTFNDSITGAVVTGMAFNLIEV